MRTNCGCSDRVSPTGVDRGRVCVLCADAYDLMMACKAKNFDVSIELHDCVHDNGFKYVGFTWTSKSTIDTHVDEDGNVISSKPKNIKANGISFYESCSVAETEGDHFNKYIRVSKHEKATK